MKRRGLRVEDIVVPRKEPGENDPIWGQVVRIDRDRNGDDHQHLILVRWEDGSTDWQLRTHLYRIAPLVALALQAPTSFIKDDS